ncbi:Fmu (Sun) domain-containing protein [Puia dinghuensis]|uniref:Methyltransferase n=1 Tax=Puia dinghuensis TaxID=1792502 RepID=A0A8J2UDY2_9BACT|nr:Fmu (Sun) domain-containing protein [Puia dinghuensis]GGB04543.1 methyltransferase [Puia dinghuensis]
MTKADGGGFKDMKFDNQLRHAADIIDTYKGEEPLHVWLKDFFRANKQMGSRDRKLFSTLVYSFYRLGYAVRDLPVKERILTGLFLCTDIPNEFLHYFKPTLNDSITRPIAEKLATAGIDPTDIFPWKEELSAAIDHEAFCLSFLRQPDLFLRIRPGQESTVRGKLENTGEFIPPFTYRLPNGFKVEEHLTPDREVVIQDYSSQRVAEFLQDTEAPHSFWDACAASGGKSILAHDLYPDMDITVSDVRESILNNLRTRFQTAGIKKYHSFLVDLTHNDIVNLPVAALVLADTPCTGSGTWGRTPEELYFFHSKAITRYQMMQRQILTNIATLLSPGATLVYCTCSVFKRENEEMAAFIRDGFGLQLHRMENLIGYPHRADTLFAARFSKA